MKKIKKIMMSFGIAIIGFINKVNAIVNNDDFSSMDDFTGPALYGPAKPWVSVPGIIKIIGAIVAFITGIIVLINKKSNKKAKIKNVIIVLIMYRSILFDTNFSTMVFCQL